METARIHITAIDDPLQTVKRKLGVTNVGMYCGSCGEFFAFAVEEGPRKQVAIEFVSDHPTIMVECPMCGAQDHRAPSDIQRFVLTEQKKHREPRARD